MKKRNKILLWCCILLLGCSYTTPYIAKQEQLKYKSNLQISSKAIEFKDEKTVTFYALGDWGEGNYHQKMVAKALKEDLSKLGKRQVVPFVIGLGDNIYKDGLPKKPFKDPEVVELLSKKFGEMYKNTLYRGQEITFHVVPGNHDYGMAIGKKEGWGDRVHEETSAEALYDGSRKNYPIFKSYPIHHKTFHIADSNDELEHQALKERKLPLLVVPQEIKIDKLESVLFVALDTQIMLNLYEQSDQKNITRHLKALKQILNNSKAKWKFLAGHHGARTYGEHNNFRPLRQWIWTGTRDRIPFYLRPLTILWGPLLSIGLEQFYITISPLIQDTNHHAYKKFSQDINNTMKQCGVDIYFAGHDHNLQMIELGKNRLQIISGSASKLDAVGIGEDSVFSQEAPGFVRIDVVGGKMQIQFLEVDIGSGKLDRSAVFTIYK